MKKHNLKKDIQNAFDSVVPDVLEKTKKAPIKKLTRPSLEQKYWEGQVKIFLAGISLMLIAILIFLAGHLISTYM